MFLVLSLYLISLSYIFIYSLYQFLLLIYFFKSDFKKESFVVCEHFPMVTIQLPIYNEMYVVERLIDAVCQIDWPKDKLEIQLLDDSTDNTKEIIAEKVSFYKKKKMLISHVHRKDRSGFKAGALCNGLSLCKGDFIAIFDADFLPKKDFLLSTIGYFQNKNIGMVQTRWGHINEKFSLLTRLQAFALNSHFSVEQKGRSTAGFFINFNGTAGVWRKKCIMDAGGWQSDTLTEDLDLSYRAQLKGWKFIYNSSINSPSELPISFEALKNQQFRWSKGAAECARKNLIRTLRLNNLTFLQRISAFFHLTNSLMFVCMMVLIVLSVPVVYIGLLGGEHDFYLNFAKGFVISTLLLGVTYFISNFKPYSLVLSLANFILLFPLFLSFCMGLGLYVSVGVVQGFFGIQSDFIRTPKYNIINRTYSGLNVYDKLSFKPIYVIEFLLMLYSFFGIFYCFIHGSYFMLAFSVMIAIGTSFSSFNTIRHALVK